MATQNKDYFFQPQLQQSMAYVSTLANGIK